MAAPPGRPRRRGRPALNAAGELSEAAWQGQVAGLARFYGWRVYHAPAGGKAGRVDREQIGAGFPDLVLLRPPELLFVELKTDRGKTTPAQDAWLADLELVGAAITAHVAEQDPHRRRNLRAGHAGDPAVEAHLWRPRDFADVERRLARGRPIIPAGFAPGSE